MDYYRMILEELQEAYASVSDISKIKFMANLKSFIGGSYGIMADIDNYARNIEEKLTYLNDTLLNLTNKFIDEFSYMHEHITPYAKYFNIIITIIAIFIIFNFILCLILIFNCRKKVYVLDKIMDKNEIELENK